MDRKVTLAILTGIFLIALLNNVSAYAFFDYNPYFNKAVIYVGFNEPDYYDYGYYRYPYNYGYGNYYRNYRYRPIEYYKTCYSYDNEDLRFERNPVCDWIEDGDGWREEYKRARAAVWVSNSYDARYNIASGRDSGDVFYYNDYDDPSLSLSNWRYKEAYEPRIYGSNGNNYYKPRYNSETKTWNWRY